MFTIVVPRFLRAFFISAFFVGFSVITSTHKFSWAEDKQAHKVIDATNLIKIPSAFYIQSDQVLRELGVLDQMDPHQNSGLINTKDYYWVISEPYQEILSKVDKSETLNKQTRIEALNELGISSEQELRETVPLELVEIYYIGLDEVPESGDDEHFKSLMTMLNGTHAVRIYLKDGRMCLIQSVNDGAIHGILFDGSDELAKPSQGSIIRADQAIFNYVYDPETGHPSFHKKKA